MKINKEDIIKTSETGTEINKIAKEVRLLYQAAWIGLYGEDGHDIFLDQPIGFIQSVYDNYVVFKSRSSMYSGIYVPICFFTDYENLIEHVYETVRCEYTERKEKLKEFKQ